MHLIIRHVPIASATHDWCFRRRAVPARVRNFGRELNQKRRGAGRLDEEGDEDPPGLFTPVRSLGEVVLGAVVSPPPPEGNPTCYRAEPKSVSGASSLVSDVPDAGFRSSSPAACGSIFFLTQYRATLKS